MKAISGRDFARVLERRGWHLVRVRGSHHLHAKGVDSIVVPIHGSQTLKVGLQRDLMKHAGLTEEELV